MFNEQIPLSGDPSRVYLLERVIALSTPKPRILDVGCGTCQLWKPVLGKYDIDLTGMDINEESVNIARDVVGNKDKIKVGDAQVLSQIFPAGFFDIVVSTQVLYQIRDVKRVLDEINLVLRPGGKLLFTTELPRPRKLSLPYLKNKSVECINRLLRKDFRKRRDDIEFSALLKETGFKVNDIRFYHIPPLKNIQNRVVSEANKNKVMYKWKELEEELLKDPNFLAQAKRWCRNMFIEATKRGDK